jgi:hypothetical protein
MTEENQRFSKRRKLSIGITCLLLIILTGSSIFLIANGKGNQGQAATLSPTHTTSSTTTQMTTAQNSAPTSTTTLAPTASSTPQPLFLDYFIDNSNGWLTGNAGGYTRTLDEGALTLSATNHKILVESLPSNTSFDDFSLTMSFMLKQGDANDSVGLYFRGDSNLDNDYRIDIYGNSTYSISKEAVDSYADQTTTYLTSPTHAPQLRPLDHGNRLTILMKGPTLVLMINDRFVQSVTDPDYTHGQIALFVENGPTSNGVEALITSIAVYPAPDELPTATPAPGTPTSGTPSIASPTTTSKK